MVILTCAVLIDHCLDHLFNINHIYFAQIIDNIFAKEIQLNKINYGTEASLLCINRLKYLNT